MNIEGYGNVAIELYFDMAPNTVANIINLINSRYYKGYKFDRVVENFIVQCGNEDSKTSEYSVKGEFTANDYINNTLKFERGTVRTS